MHFPIAGLMDGEACHAKLLAVLHPAGLPCPGRGSDRLGAHHRSPAFGTRRRARRCVFNACAGTALQGPRRRPATLVVILRGVAEGRLDGTRRANSDATGSS